jgi:hypothetical protein
MTTKSSALKKLNPQKRSKDETRKRLSIATKVLSSNAHDLARSTRARHYQSGKVSSLPSKKPRLVENNNSKDRSFVGVMRLFGVGVIFSIVVVVVIQTVIAGKVIKIDAIKDKQRNEITKYRKIRKDIAVLKSPERINRRAAFLGLVQPQQFISINIPYKSDLTSDLKDDLYYSELKAILNGS